MQVNFISAEGGEQSPCPDTPPKPVWNILFLTILTSTLKLKAVYSSETLVYRRKITRRNNPEDHHLYSHRRGNLKSYWNKSDDMCTRWMGR
jgi:hypothetical protein